MKKRKGSEKNQQQQQQEQQQQQQKYKEEYQEQRRKTLFERLKLNEYVFHTDKDLDRLRNRIVSSDLFQQYIESRTFPNKSYWHRYVFVSMLVGIPIWLAMKEMEWSNQRFREKEMQKWVIRDNFEPFATIDQIRAYEEIPPRTKRETVGLYHEKVFTNKEVARLKFEDMSLNEQMSQLTNRLEELKKKKEQMQQSKVPDTTEAK